MKCLTPAEINEWMKRHGHHVEPDNVPVLSFDAPGKFPVMECFVECVLRDVFVHGEILMVVTDTDLGRFRHTRLFEAFRHLTGEIRKMEEAPGFLFLQSEWQDVVTLFSLTASFSWKCYLWGDHDQITLFNWEGEIFDIWPGNERGRNATSDLLTSFNLEKIERKAGENSANPI